MPAVLKRDAWPLWLGEQPAELAPIKALLVPYPSDGDDCVAGQFARRQRQEQRSEPDEAVRLHE
jgi:hypothetical protein